MQQAQDHKKYYIKTMQLCKQYNLNYKKGENVRNPGLPPSKRFFNITSLMQKTLMGLDQLFLAENLLCLLDDNLHCFLYYTLGDFGWPYN